MYQILCPCLVVLACKGPQASIVVAISLLKFLGPAWPNLLLSLSLSKTHSLSLSMFLSFAELMDDDPPLSQSLFSRPTDHLRLFDDAAIWAHVSMHILFFFE